MLLNVFPNCVVVRKERGDDELYKDSRLWYHVKNRLNKEMGYSPSYRHKMVKKEMAADGHLVSPGQHYLINGRAHEKVGVVHMVHDTDYQIRTMYSVYNRYGQVELMRSSYSLQRKDWTNDQQIKVAVELWEQVDGLDYVLYTLIHQGKVGLKANDSVKSYKHMNVGDVLQACRRVDETNTLGLVKTVGKLTRFTEVNNNEA